MINEKNKSQKKIHYLHVISCFSKLSTKYSKGITLVALVVTIIVLLILAGVTITVLFSDDGIIRKAQDAANSTNAAVEDELQGITNLGEQMNSILEGINPGEIELPIEEALTEGKYVEYIDRSGEPLLCAVLYGPENANYENYGIQIVSMSTTADVALTGMNSYNNSIEELNSKADDYIITKYVASARSVGTIPDSPSTTENVNNADTNYETDWNQMTKLGISNINQNYWMPSRVYSTGSNTSSYSLRIVDANGNLTTSRLYYSNSNPGMDSYASTQINGLRPVFTLSEGLKVRGGAGTEEDPYILLDPADYKNELRSGDYVIYTDSNENTWKCAVLYSSISAYGTQIVTMDTLEDVTLSGTASYNSARSTLNTRAAAYLNDQYASAARSIGTIPDSPDSTENVNNADTNYVEDWKQMNKLGIYNISKNYWVPSRVYTSGNNTGSYYLRMVDTSGNLTTSRLYYSNSNPGMDSSSYSQTNGLRAVFTLKDEIKILSGTGEENNPYVLGTSD